MRIFDFFFFFLRLPEVEGDGLARFLALSHFFVKRIEAIEAALTEQTQALMDKERQLEDQDHSIEQRIVCLEQSIKGPERNPVASVASTAAPAATLSPEVLHTVQQEVRAQIQGLHDEIRTNHATL